jgi:hypothetical protein
MICLKNMTCSICAPTYGAPYCDFSSAKKLRETAGGFLEHQCLFSSWITFQCNVNYTVL